MIFDTQTQIGHNIFFFVFQLRKRQGQLGIHHHLTEGKYAVHVTLSSTWKTGLNSSFSLVNRKFPSGEERGETDRCFRRLHAPGCLH